MEELFKLYSEITEPDSRWQYLVGIDPKLFKESCATKLKEFHSEISEIRLLPQAPEQLKSAFNTARNVFLYSWFVYSMIPVAVMHAYSTMEMALRIKIGHSAERLSFKRCFQKAIDRNWINDKGFRHFRELEGRRENLIAGDENSGSYANDPQHYCKILRDCVPDLRNSHAHGHAMLYPGCLHELELCADLINQLFYTE